MAFEVVRGGKLIEDEPVFDNGSDELPGEGGLEGAPDADGHPDNAGQDYNDALLLNQKLKALLAEAEAVAPGHRSHGAASSGRGQQRRVPRVPSTPQGLAYPAESLAARESSQGINRRKFDQKVRQENAGIAVRLAGSKSCILPPLNLRQGQQESSQSINRRKFAEKVHRENASLVTRIEQPGRVRSLGPPRQAGEAALPPGWTRGIGGRAMPPPKQRWGTKPKFDAGEWLT